MSSRIIPDPKRWEQKNLLDEFAMIALPLVWENSDKGQTYDEIVDDAYDLAEEMMKRRKQE
jgi:hypothetical protein